MTKIEFENGDSVEFHQGDHFERVLESSPDQKVGFTRTVFSGWVRIEPMNLANVEPGMMTIWEGRIVKVKSVGR